MLYIVNSFDYELFMGQNYVGEEEVLIKPTDKLSKMLYSEDVPSTFFADVLCPVRYRELGLHEFPDAFDKQLRELNYFGHDVQLHLHPHWLKASRVGREVEFDRKYYRIHNWISSSGNATPLRSLIRQGKRYLEKTIKPVDDSYNCIAYRAGGYCLQPESVMAPILYAEGIRIDSSVCYGHAYNKDGMLYDYTCLPKVYNQFFSEKHGLAEGMQDEPQDEESIFEVPVWGFKSFPYRVIASKKNKKISNAVVTGSGMALTQPGQIGFLERFKRILTACNMLTFDFFHADSMVYMINKIAQERVCREKDVFISIISHPKGQSNQHIDNMQAAIRRLKQNSYIRFVSMKQVAAIKNL